MEIQRQVNLTAFTTFKLPFIAKYFAVIKSLPDLKEASEFVARNDIPTARVLILGEGSNILKNQNQIYDGLVLKMEILGLDVIQEQAGEVYLKIGAGEVWDSVVSRTVAMGLSGVEAMSAIPGTAGATPIQNVGAYGREIKDVLVELECYELETGVVKVFSNTECEFGYRDSIFKHRFAGQYAITSITIKLTRQPAVVPDYQGVKEYFIKAGIANPSQSEIRQAIIAIRNIKLPDPKIVASVGSFFKNPIISQEHFLRLQKNFSGVKTFQLESGQHKVSAGWLLESLGYKGKQIGNLQFYPNNALVLVNRSDATFLELMTLVDNVKLKVQQTYGIDLEIEPLVI